MGAVSTAPGCIIDRREWFEWLADMGAIRRVADWLDVDDTVRDRTVGDPGAYRVTPDDAEADEFVVGDEF